MYVYPLAEVEAVSRWASTLAATLPTEVEMLVMLGSGPPGASCGVAGKIVGVVASVFADDEAVASRHLRVLETCPSLDRAIIRSVDQPSSFGRLHDTLAQRLPEGRRYLEDAIWASTDYATLLPELAEQIVRAPSSQSLFMTTMRPFGNRPLRDGALSMQADTFALCYAIWDEPHDDAANQAWLRAAASAVARHTVGHYIAEADLARDATRAVGSFTPAAWSRLQTVRSRYDPHGLFHDFLGVQ